MAPKLLQLKIDSSLKSDLENVATYKGISVTSLVKMTLTEVIRKEKRQMFTENGLTAEEELEILRRERESLKEHRNKKGKPLSAKSLLKELNR